jgi:hypothetical protein
MKNVNIALILNGNVGTMKKENDRMEKQNELFK